MFPQRQTLQRFEWKYFFSLLENWGNTGRECGYWYTQGNVINRMYIIKPVTTVEGWSLSWGDSLAKGVKHMTHNYYILGAWAWVYVCQFPSVISWGLLLRVLCLHLYPAFQPAKCVGRVVFHISVKSPPAQRYRLLYCDLEEILIWSFR